LGADSVVSKYYVVVLVPQHDGGWRAHFPDIPNCRAEGERVEIAIERAAGAASRLVNDLRGQGLSVVEPRGFEEIRVDTKWAEERAIDWSKVVVSLVAIPR
jgi:predicted RNase H-like HicB family nuclease